ncbi:MAG: hypothetical protein HYX80_04350, partial [Chloroflexi bacterium]|nr:hypothetical protein [Chloroflexota bacterium]
MNKRILWSAVSLVMALSLILAACAPAATTPTAPTTPTTPTAPPTPTTPTQPLAPTAPEKEAVAPAAEKPVYGGALNRHYNGGALSFDDSNVSPNAAVSHVNQKLFEGDWTKGIAGGYGAAETKWGTDYPDIFALKTGMLAESAKWTADFEKNEGTIVYQIRQGV